MIDPVLFVQVPQGSALERQLASAPPPTVASGEVDIEIGPADGAGVLEPAEAGEVVASIPSPESLRREPEELHRAVRQAGPGAEPVVIVVEVAEELREDELAAALEVARRSPRPVILRVMRDA